MDTLLLVVRDPVLVQDEYIKPLLVVHRRSQPLDLVLLLPCLVQPLITDVSEPVQRELGHPLLQQDRLDLDVLDVFSLAKVVDQVGTGEDVQRAQVALAGQRAAASGIIVVAVNNEERQSDIEVGVLVVYSRKAIVEVIGGVAHDLDPAIPPTDEIFKAPAPP